ncbi:rhodanese-like domain-containing protein [Tenacibaculum maritimum]|uniref:rhodanese-like domain-containing protein n=1 Tax=Tenacibaculum maritimum TaxID=107401 RepID=UPI0012E5E48D|nr:rhodanese-like domain-containing protein [Tenacibaculum maritimum]CAA0173794.1 conserved hypothetical protein [Tenacibaculum maritimum]
MKVYFIISTFLLVTLSCITDSIKEISVKDLKKVLTSKNEKVQLVDVRTKEEYQKEWIQSSVLIDIKNENFEELVDRELNKNEPVYLYCKSGKRSSSAFRVLKKKGFKKVFSLEGGIVNWKSNH